MRARFFGLALVLGVLLAGGVAAETVTTEQDSTPIELIGVRYEWAGTEGMLSISSRPGIPFSAMASTGEVVAVGVTEPNVLMMPVRNTGPGPDGGWLTIVVGETQFVVTDPDWIWQH
jgi:hypothetical protein